MTRSRDIIFPRAGEVVLADVEVDEPGPGQVLCRAQKSLVSRGTETFCLKGEFDPGTYWEDYIRYPMPAGYSMVATVEAAGHGSRYRLGDRVTGLHPHKLRFVASDSALYPVPDEIDDDEATWASLGRTTQLGVRRADLQLGETVGVVGLGILGQLVVQYLAIAGARRIVVVDTVESRVKTALAHGATHGFVGPVSGALEEVSRITNGHMLDAAFEITGNAAVLAPATLLLRKLGRLILLGDSPMPSRQTLGPRIVGDSLSILGMHGLMYPEQATVFSPWTAEEMTAVFFDFLKQKRMAVKQLIDRTESPKNAAAVYQGLLSGADQSIGILFDWTGMEGAIS